MSISYPSKKFTLLDVPEVREFNASFKYNFFVTDEKSNESGDPRFQGSLDVDSKNSIIKKIPRWVEFNISPVDLRTNIAVDNEFLLNISDPKNVNDLIYNNLEKIQNENELVGKGYSALSLQDLAFSNKSSDLLNGSLNIRNTQNKNKKNLNTRTEGIKALNGMTSDLIKGKFLKDMSGQLEQVGANFFDHSKQLALPNVPVQITQLKQHLLVNEKFIHNIVLKAVADPTSPYMNELSQQLASAINIQSAATERVTSNIIHDYQYDPIITPISVDKVDPDKFTSAAKIIGYIIDKSELLPDRTVKNHSPIIVVGSSSSVAVDLKIKYAAVYRYSIRSIALVQFQAIDEETSQTYAVSGLLTSQSSKEIEVKCQDYYPPEPPADLDFVWDYGEKKLMIMWSFPVIPQRDIKRFQVFKRADINLPFELQIEYDFDDSEIPEPRSERPRASNVIEMKSPMTTYWDYEFTKDSFAIYSLCSIDAHDLSSNYSMQYAVWFDQVNNKLMKKLISPSGAPKPYPNFYLIENVDLIGVSSNLTNDCMKDTGHTSCKIYFDPEYLSVKGDNNNHLDLWATTQEGGNYLLQFINVDRQKSQTVNINVSDLRTKQKVNLDKVGNLRKTNFSK